MVNRALTKNDFEAVCDDSMPSHVSLAKEDLENNLSNEFNEGNRHPEAPPTSKNKAMIFPEKLMQVLSNKKYENMISWLPHGKSFAIHDTKRFVTEILPIHFKQAKYSSFTRKLRRWGFQSILRGEETGSFYHKMFLRDDKSMCLKMTCSLAGKTKILKKSQPIPTLKEKNMSSKSDLTLKEECIPDDLANLTKYVPLNRTAFEDSISFPGTFSDLNLALLSEQYASQMLLSHGTLGVNIEQLNFLNQLNKIQNARKILTAIHTGFLQSPVTDISLSSHSRADILMNNPNLLPFNNFH